ncbi:hypothetical protein PYCCODRAFT_1029984 [Trametes coccinea BRFM310]|uniref:Uncharacterized protein n=1 Tax=Trametes coccinea (strain BRFM310) TaxID=1353009 RepID=A0A1Y2IAB4_TRAC3|nr:hypothetical protein PYCCODRAFT_1029984 [Trametes coccinea BRFM310]
MRHGVLGFVSGIVRCGAQLIFAAKCNTAASLRRPSKSRQQVVVRTRCNCDAQPAPRCPGWIVMICASVRRAKVSPTSAWAAEPNVNANYNKRAHWMRSRLWSWWCHHRPDADAIVDTGVVLYRISERSAMRKLSEGGGGCIPACVAGAACCSMGGGWRGWEGGMHGKWYVKCRPGARVRVRGRVIAFWKRFAYQHGITGGAACGDGNMLAVLE